MACLGWIRRIEERADELPPLFLDNIDVKPLRKKIEACLADTEPTGKMITAPATCNKCGTQTISPTTGLCWNECWCGGELVSVANADLRHSADSAASQPKETTDEK